MRHPKPHWKEGHKCWYLKLDGRFIRLDANEDAAWEKYHQIMAERAASQPGNSDLTSQNATVRQLLAVYMEWSKIHNKERTHDFYDDYLAGKKGFAAYLQPQQKIEDLKNFHVTGFLDKHYSHVTTASRASIISALKRPFNWAIDEGYITQNPIASFKKPAAIGRSGSDEVYVSDAEYETLLNNIRANQFRDYVEFMYQTGCRAEEINMMRTIWFKLKERRCVIPAEFTKSNKLRRQPRPRVIRLNERALEIAARNALKNPSGHLFRNTRGRPWTASAADCQFKRKSLIKSLGRKLVATWFRHTYITDALKFGIGPVQVAKLVGHDSLQMIMQVYEHVGIDDIHVDQTWIAKMKPRFTLGTVEGSCSPIQASSLADYPCDPVDISPSLAG